ncbi:hypothetical protein Tco_0908041 [Tanacetum coccineum]|uniref:Uncharacterized protein n=1 Tax=Tanacetum coccineum TaxID=301880 RepID=A0ABQ5CPI1_9ASTR
MIQTSLWKNTSDSKKKKLKDMVEHLIGELPHANEFPAIVYNDALTSKLYFLTEPDVSPQHIDEFDLKDETSLSECDEEEQNILYFNDLFPFNVIYPDDSKSDKDNDDDKIDIKHSSGGNVINTDDGAYAQRMQYGDLAVKKSTISYTLKKMCVELIRAF